MADIHREESGISGINGNLSEISRQDIKAVIAKAVEPRALHASLKQQGIYSPKIPSFSPLSRHASHLSAQDYPVFTPSYDDDPLPGYQQILMENRNYAESWGETLDGGGNVEASVLSDYISANESSSRKGLAKFEGHICPEHSSKSRTNSLGNIASISSCNKCRPALISSESEGLTKKGGKSNIIVPLTDSHSSLHPQPRSKGLGLSWLFPRLKKKKKSMDESSLPHARRDQASQMLKDLGVVSVEILKKEVLEANNSRDAVLSQVADMRLSLGELKSKLEYLEAYCEQLKTALRQAVHVKISDQPCVSKRGKSIDGNVESSMPVREEVMVAGFLQIVSEARSSVKQFCKNLVKQIEDTDHTLVENFNSLLQPYKLSLTSSKHSKAVLHHLEAIINQSLYEDFENCAFQKNGAPKHLDPQQHRQAQFQSFIALRDLNWNEVLRKGTKYHSEELSKFCDEKMSAIVATLGCTRPWPEQLLQAFFVAAKCIWLLHLLALSFNQPIGILRVDENMAFDASFMEDLFGERQRPQGPSRVQIMVMPGFYVLDRVLRCKVLCRYKSVS